MNDQMDEHQLEEYLRSFQPLPPAPLPVPERRWGFVALNAVAAGIMIALLVFFQSVRVTPASVVLQPITIGSANKLLTGSASWNSVVDDPGFAFRPLQMNVTPGHRSALEFLGQEDPLK